MCVIMCGSLATKITFQAINNETFNKFLQLDDHPAGIFVLPDIFSFALCITARVILGMTEPPSKLLLTRKLAWAHIVDVVVILVCPGTMSIIGLIYLVWALDRLHRFASPERMSTKRLHWQHRALSTVINIHLLVRCTIDFVSEAVTTGNAENGRRLKDISEWVLGLKSGDAWSVFSFMLLWLLVVLFSHSAEQNKKQELEEIESAVSSPSKVTLKRHGAMMALNKSEDTCCGLKPFLDKAGVLTWRFIKYLTSAFLLHVWGPICCGVCAFGLLIAAITNISWPGFVLAICGCIILLLKQRDCIRVMWFSAVMVSLWCLISYGFIARGPHNDVHISREVDVLANLSLDGNAGTHLFARLLLGCVMSACIRMAKIPPPPVDDVVKLQHFGFGDYTQSSFYKLIVQFNPIVGFFRVMFEIVGRPILAVSMLGFCIGVLALEIGHFKFSSARALLYFLVMTPVWWMPMNFKCWHLLRWVASLIFIAQYVCRLVLTFAPLEWIFGIERPENWNSFLYWENAPSGWKDDLWSNVIFGDALIVLLSSCAVRILFTLDHCPRCLTDFLSSGIGLTELEWHLQVLGKAPPGATNWFVLFLCLVMVLFEPVDIYSLIYVLIFCGVLLLKHVHTASSMQDDHMRERLLKKGNRLRDIFIVFNGIGSWILLFARILFLLPPITERLFDSGIGQDSEYIHIDQKELGLVVVQGTTAKLVWMSILAMACRLVLLASVSSGGIAQTIKNYISEIKGRDLATQETSDLNQISIDVDGDSLYSDEKLDTVETLVTPTTKSKQFVQIARTKTGESFVTSVGPSPAVSTDHMQVDKPKLPILTRMKTKIQYLHSNFLLPMYELTCLHLPKLLIIVVILISMQPEFFSVQEREIQKIFFLQIFAICFPKFHRFFMFSTANQFLLSTF